MKIDKYEHGVPSWVDLGSPDPQVAADFYSALFGWECPEGPPETGGYRVCTMEDVAVAGIGPAQNPGPPVWASYIDVADADATAASVTANGGQVILAPMDVMDFGRMAVFADPLGQFISAWQAGTHPGAQIVNEPGTLTWNELITNDVDRSIEFYTAVFGWGSETHGEGPGAYTEWQIGGRSIAGMMLKPPTMPAQVPPHWAVYFAVADTDLAAARVAELGGTVMMPPTDIEPGRFSAVLDPTGAAFNIIAMASEPAE
jgi:predicted enzyme related to lactoylglutathione lyase